MRHAKCTSYVTTDLATPSPFGLMHLTYLAPFPIYTLGFKRTSSIHLFVVPRGIRESGLRKAFFPWVVNQIRSEAKGWHSLPKIGRIPGYVWRIWSDMNQIASILVAQFAFRTSRKTLTFSQVSPLSWINAADSVAQYKEKKNCSQEQAAIPSSCFRHIPPQEYDDKPNILPKWCLLPQAGTPK